MKLKFVSGVQPDESYTPRELEHRKLAYEAACEGIVLLENDGTLPLQPGKSTYMTGWSMPDLPSPAKAGWMNM